MKGATFVERRTLVAKLLEISRRINCPHSNSEMLDVIKAILTSRTDKNCVIVEAGCYKGGSTSKLSLAAKLSGRKLVVFDSFEGIPENTEDHGKNIYGFPTTFKKGDYCGKLDEVTENVRRFGDLGSCHFVKGWFDDTMPSFDERIAVAYVDVDLASSTKTCLRYLYNRLDKNGVLFSQDGHLPLVLAVFRDAEFWDEIGVREPVVFGLNKRKLIFVRPTVTR